MPGDIGNRASSASSFSNLHEGQDGYMFLGQWDTPRVESKRIFFFSWKTISGLLPFSSGRLSTNASRLNVKVVCESNIRRLISFNMLTTPPLMLMSTFLSMHEHHPQQPFGDLDNSGVVELLLSSRQVQNFIPRSKVITHIQPKGG